MREGERERASGGEREKGRKGEREKGREGGREGDPETVVCDGVGDTSHTLTNSTTGKPTNAILCQPPEEVEC